MSAPVPEHLTLAELEDVARTILPPNTFEFVQSGARDELTVAANRAAWRSWQFVPRMFTDVSAVAIGTTVLGQAIDVPVLVAPMSAQRLAHPEGEVAVTRATASAGTINIVSQATMSPLEEIGAVPGARFWAQHYPFVDLDANEEIVRLAVAAGAGAIVLTIDAPLRVATRRRPRGGFFWPPVETLAVKASHGQVQLTALTIEYLDWLHGVADVPIVVKGVMHPDDARLAADHGAAAIVVSNHGGRTLDGSIPTAHVLPEIVTAVSDQIEVYVDGGIRRGGDVLRALALGARAVLVGRPVFWGLAYAGETGVAHVLGSLKRELVEDAALSGVADVRSIRPGLVRRAQGCAHCGPE